MLTEILTLVGKKNVLKLINKKWHLVGKYLYNYIIEM